MSKEKQYRFKCPHCGSMEGIRISSWGKTRYRAEKFSVDGDELDAELIQEDYESRDYECLGCYADLDSDDISANLVPIEEGGSNE